MEQYRGSGIGFGTILFIAFLVLKLCGIIAWSWWWVCSPLWIPIVLVIGIILVGIVIGGIIALFSALFD
jgi:hypothetical protein